jgi:hypothetical protein
MYKRHGLQMPIPLCAIYSIPCVSWRQLVSVRVSWCQLGIIDIFDGVPLARLWRAFASWQKAMAI